jgi:hypothetical protein
MPYVNYAPLWFYMGQNQNFLANIGMSLSYQMYKISVIWFVEYWRVLLWLYVSQALL